MADQRPTSVSKMIKDLRSETEAYRRSSSSSNSFPLRRDSQLHRASTSKQEESLHETPKRPKLDDTAVNGSLNKSDAESVPGSPWEWRKMKGENIALKSRLGHQEATVEKLHNVRREMEEIFQKEKKLLEIQLDESKQMIKQLELRVDVGRQTIQDAKAAQAKAERDLIQIRSKMEKKILSLVDDNNRLTEDLRRSIKQEVKTDHDNSMNMSRAVEGKSDLEEKVEAYRKRMSELQEKLREVTTVANKYEVQNVELQNLRIKCETLEAEKINLEEGKKFATPVARVCELEKELHHAKEIIFSLRESVKGKLLLEEQMATMEHRLQRTENLEKQISQLEVTQSELLGKIADYEAIGISGGPTAIRREVARLQRSEAILLAEEGQTRSSMDALRKELLSAQQVLEETRKSVAELTTSNERLSRFVARLQKKMSLVTRERDSYRQQLDAYEKEITGYQNTEACSLINERIPALERAVEGYRDLVTKLEADVESLEARNHGDEFKKIKEENDRLRTEFEHRALKGDFNVNSRIMHYKFNPAAIAEQLADDKQKALLQEVETLRTLAASGNHSGVPAVSSLQAQELAELQQKHEIKINRLKEAFKASSHEYRQACYQLFGWRVDRTKEGQYKLSSQYAESPDDYLFFIVNEDGVNMIETPFSATLVAFIERHLKGQHSVPMFLNAVQSDLFDHQTVATVIN